MPAKIHIERMMHRNSIAVPGESAASYALVKLIPSGDGAETPLGLNLALVLETAPAKAGSIAFRMPPCRPSRSSSRTTRWPSSLLAPTLRSCYRPPA
ncbi:MAG: hypothetical protein E6K70_26715 [Planctomycetota bacterium]|nr:MAG: hypothetical protein E6K70_26715 [Planctomycetota bacterium]